MLCDSVLSHHVCLLRDQSKHQRPNQPPVPLCPERRDSGLTLGKARFGWSVPQLGCLPGKLKSCGIADSGTPPRVYVQSSDELTLGARLNGQRRDHRAGKLDPAKGKKLNELLPGWRQGRGHRGGRRKPKGQSAAPQGEPARDPSRSMTLTGWPAPFKAAGCAPPARRQLLGLAAWLASLCCCSLAVPPGPRREGRLSVLHRRAAMRPSRPCSVDGHWMPPAR